MTITGQLTEHSNDHTPGSAEGEDVFWGDRASFLTMQTMLLMEQREEAYISDSGNYSPSLDHF